MHQASNPLNDARRDNLIALRFGPFELDVRSGEMKRYGSSVKIQPQPFKVLVLLASRTGEVVTREEIQAEVWPAGTFVDFEQSLNFCIRQIRAALGDNALSPRFVETLPRRGYRWVGGPVERVTPGAQLREWPRRLGTEAGAVPAPPDDCAELLPVGSEAGDALAETPPQGTAVPFLPPAAPTLPPGPAVGRRQVPLAAALLGIVLAVAAGAIAARLAAGRAPAAGPPPSFQRLTFRRGFVNSARFSPDGQVVFSAAWDGQPARVYVTRTDPRNSRSTDITDARIVGVSSSGEVAFLCGKVLSRAPLAGGPPKDVLKDVLVADWAGDGADFAVVRLVGDHLQAEFPLGHPLGTVLKATRIRVSPDGRYVALTQHPQPDDDRGGVVVLDRSGRKVAASDGWGSLDGLAWHGAEVWFTATRVGADNSLQALSLDGSVRTVLAGMGRLVLHDVAPDGRLLIERTNQRSEMLFAREGQADSTELSWLDYSAATAMSADGSTVLFFESGQGGGADYTTFVRKTDGSLPVRVGTGRAVSLSPDGQWMLSIPLREPDHVDVVPVGPGEPRQVRIAGAGVDETAGFVGDGRTLFVSTRDESRKRATWLVGADGSNPRRLPLPDGRSLLMNTFSPDGTRFLARCPSGDVPCVFRVDGGAPVPVKGALATWWPIGWDERGRLYFVESAKYGNETLKRVDPTAARVEALSALSPRDRAGVQGLLPPGVVVSRKGDAWVFNVLRRLSDLHIVSDVR
jgi:DNA-binding winged helix-turn-helix (wHTH) protein